MFGRHPGGYQRRTRLFKKGDLKYVILDLLKDKSAHGYEITVSLEERFHGLYSPSTGSVYPILQLLQDMGYVTANEKDGKKVYTITDAGRGFLKEEKETTDKIKWRVRGWFGPEKLDYIQDVRAVLTYSHNIRHLIGEIAVQKDSAKLVRVKEILSKTLKEITTVAEQR